MSTVCVYNSSTGIRFTVGGSIVKVHNIMG